MTTLNTENKISLKDRLQKNKQQDSLKRMKTFNHIEISLGYDDLLAESSKFGRRYQTPEGNRYPSITTILSILSEDSIKEWRARVGEETANKISRRASDRGTRMHTIAEKYLLNESDYLEDALPHVVELFKSIKPILDKRVDNVHFQEVALYSDKLQVAGRVDCIAEFDGVLSIIDYKTSSKKKEEAWISSYFMQAAFYAAAYYERTGIPIQQSVIVMAVESDDPQVFIQPTFEWLKPFMEVRDEYRKRKGI